MKRNSKTVIAILAFMQLVFLTSCVEETVPGITTFPISNITYNEATCGGVVSFDGGSSVSARGICWSLSPNPTIENFKISEGVGEGDFTCQMTDLISDTVYYVKAYAVNSIGIKYGSELSFRTAKLNSFLPIVTTDIISEITFNSATSGGSVLSDGNSEITERGICWSLMPNPTIEGDKTIDSLGLGDFTSSMTGLISDTIYYVRAYAKNSSGVQYGKQKSFTTKIEEIVDADGNLYHAVRVGKQTWMVENLKTTKYNDGTSIPVCTNDYSWTTLSTPAYAYVFNDIYNKSTYGLLYNFYTVNTGKLAPIGWHIPTETELATLVASLGGEAIAGGKIKEIGIDATWDSPNTGATNASRLSATAGGYKTTSHGGSVNVGVESVWWSSTVKNGVPVRFGLSCNNTTSNIGTNSIASINNFGFNVRCIKD